MSLSQEKLSMDQALLNFQTGNQLHKMMAIFSLLARKMSKHGKFEGTSTYKEPGHASQQEVKAGLNQVEQNQGYIACTEI